MRTSRRVPLLFPLLTRFTAKKEKVQEKIRWKKLDMKILK